MKNYGNAATANFRNISFKDLIFRQYAPGKLLRDKNHPIIGMDTETYKGYAKLICDSNRDFVYNPGLDDSLAFLSRKQLRKHHIFFYNMDYDVQSILKRLPIGYLRALVRKNKVQYKQWLLKYIPEKFFSIRSGHHVCRYYDLWQFYEQSLDEASRKYLNEHKTVTPFDSAELNEDINVWKAYKPEIINYCIQDAILAKKLGYVLQNYVINEIKLRPQSYISKASLSKEYFRKNCVIPDIRKIPEQVSQLAFYAYKGGRFELLQKGHFEYAEMYDIKSAYPYEIQNLIDINDGVWKYARDLNPDAYYGFYLCKVNIPYQHICPLPYILRNDVLCYPFGKWRTVITKKEIEETLTPDQYEIEYGYEFYPNNITYPFRESINNLFQIKEKVDPDSYLYSLTKIVMNALYGTFYEKIKRPDGIYTGKLFNPVYASIITRGTRIKAYQYAKQHEFQVIGFATDSVIFHHKQNPPTGANIGDWSMKASGECVCIQSGLYLIENELKTRGFKIGSKISSAEGKFKNIFQYIQAYPDRTSYKCAVHRPLHLVESLIHAQKYSVNDVNRWLTFQKTLHINRDVKRIFDTDFNGGGELWQKNVQSSPLFVGDLYTMKTPDTIRKKVSIRERRRARKLRISEMKPDIDPLIKTEYGKDIETLSEMKSGLKQDQYMLEYER